MIMKSHLICSGTCFPPCERDGISSNACYISESMMAVPMWVPTWIYIYIPSIIAWPPISALMFWSLMVYPETILLAHAWMFEMNEWWYCLWPCILLHGCNDDMRASCMWLWWLSVPDELWDEADECLIFVHLLHKGLRKLFSSSIVHQVGFWFCPDGSICVHTCIL